MAIISLFKCQHCDQYICLDNTILSKNGKMIPLNATGEFKHEIHDCMPKINLKQEYYCFRCGEKIWFADGENHVPMDDGTDSEHDCPKKRYRRYHFDDYDSYDDY